MSGDDRLSSRISAIVDRLREIILSTRPGTMIGQEPDLCARLGCTRAMLRQACRLLEFQGLLVVRRGVRGGYFGARPSADTVVETAAIYLEARQTSLEEALRAANTFTIEAVRLASACPRNHPARRHMMELRHELEGKFPEDMDAIEFAADEGRIDEAIFEMVNNDPLELLIKILNRISIHEFGERLFVRQPLRRVQFRNLRFQLIDHILAGHATEAMEVMNQMNARIVEWMPACPADELPRVATA